MAFQHLISEVSNVPSISAEVEILFNRNLEVPKIDSTEDLDTLLDLLPEVLGCKINQGVRRVNIAIMAVHSTVLKPYVSSSSLEDDFI